MASCRMEAVAPPERQTLPLHVELLEDIFLRLSSPVDLATISTVCFAFRQAVTDPNFLRRYRSAHPPLLLGFLLGGLLRDGFQPAVPPHPNAAAARALAGAANGFNFDYLPHGGWYYCDVCEGRVLIKCARQGRIVGGNYPDLAVCDPLCRRYRLLPPIPDDLIASTQAQTHRSIKAFLVPSGNLEDTSFEVIVKTEGLNKVVIFIYSSQYSHWSLGISTSWTDLGFDSPRGLIQTWSQFDHGCFYWQIANLSKVLQLNINKMEISIVDLPPDHNLTSNVVFVETGGNGRLVVLSIKTYATTVHHYIISKNEGEKTNQWQMEKAIPLPCPCDFIGASAGYIFLVGSKHERRVMSRTLYSLEIKTMKIERVCPTSVFSRAHPYFAFPPFLASRRVQME